jgi:YVTN family beta-propeller protein
MRVKRRLAVAMASAVAVVGSVASATLSAASAQAATTTSAVALPITQYSHMVVDPVHRHLFISGGGSSSSILVTDYSGQTVATIPNESGAYGLALSGDGSTVYAALSGSGAISAISTSTLTETARYATGPNPAFVAYTSGKIWFSYFPPTPGAQAGIGSIDPSTSPATVTLNATNDPFNAWTGAPMLAASPNGELVAGGPPGGSPIELASYDVSSGTATVLAPKTFVDAASNLESMQITPDGKDVVVASAAPYYHQVFQVSNLSAAGEYPTTNYPDSVSIASDGTVAAGTDSGSNEVFLFAPGGSTPLKTYTFGSNWLDLDGVAITPDASELFAVTSANGSGSNPTLNIISDPVQGPSTLSVTGPATDNKDQAITLTGTLGGTSPYAGGQTLQVTRIDPTNPDGVALPDVTTAADGSFTITDTPPKVNVDSGTVTYKVSYAGDAYLTASTASASVTVHYNNS